MPAPTCLIVMGVSGSGKSTLLAALAVELGWVHADGDDLHPPENIQKMAAGIALNDQDRAPWLATIGNWIDGHQLAGEPCLVACSALKAAYRQSLRAGRLGVKFVFLTGPEAVLRGRVAGRKGHFMPAHLLTNQLQILEVPTDAELTLDIGQSTAEQLERVKTWLALQQGFAP